MTTFFWVALGANLLTVIIALAALLIVVWLGPRRWTNLSFALLLSAIILWMGGSLIARLIVNVPQIGGDAQLFLNLLALGFAAIGITLFWFVESFYPLPRPWLWAANLMGIVVYGWFIVGLTQNGIITDAGRGSNGGLTFKFSTLGTALSTFHYVYDGMALAVLLRRARWREHWHLIVGVGTVVATSVVALTIPHVPIQTYMITVATLFMTYEVVKQQLFNPMLAINQRLEAEVQTRTQELTASLAEQERVRSELTIARNIQLSLLPRTTPQPPCLQIAGRSVPAQEVGGDFFAYHEFQDGRLGVAVGDVSGKGIPAALLMAFSLRTFEMLVDAYRDQGELLTACNSALAPRLIQSGMQSGFLSLMIDGPRQAAVVANAGMITPLLWRDGTIRSIESWGLPLGAQSDTRYQQQAVALRHGDLLLLVSDGIVEAMNGAREMWGFPRLEAMLASIGHCAPAEVVDAILNQVQRYVDGARPHDDMTVVAVRLTDHA